ncbi:MAG: hypothetical protein SVG88_14650 [Halobacteriales archaeon]|nr:hypothetical protein [Halobacteriales archaeon]
MRPNDAYEHFETEFSYPITRTDVINATDDTTIHAPTGTSDSIGDVIARTETTTFRSPQELYETFLANLGEQYIGRKFYDDRSCNIGNDNRQAF